MACCVLAVFTRGGTALAYNRGNADAYADKWATSTNSNYPTYGEDCTNFVSQALSAGGYPFIGSQPCPWCNSSDDSQWWGYWFLGHWFHTNSWAVAGDLYNFQIEHYPGGWLEETVNDSQSDYWANYDNVNMIGGDVLFFDLGTGAGIDHAAFQVWSGYSQIATNYYGSAWYGDLSDQHSPGQLHNTWSHLPTNGNWATTTIYEVHIDDRN
jgi:hypothetical protein